MEQKLLISMVHVLCLCFLPVLPILIFYILRSRKSPSSQKLPLPPGPRLWQIIGNLFHLERNLHVATAQFAEVYGSLISFKLGAQLVVVGCSPKAAAEILKTHDRALSGRALREASPYRGTSLDGFSVVGANECTETWKSLRTLFRSELFSARAIELQSSLREKKAAQMIEYLKTMNRNAVNIREVIYTFVFNTVSNLLLSKDLISFGEHGDVFGLKGKISRMLEEFATPNIGEFLPILAPLDIQGLRKKTLENTIKLSDVWQVFIEERRQRNGFGHQKQQDFLDVFLANNFSDDQIKVLFSELFVTATETTTTAVEWGLAELIKNKEAIEKLTDELRKAIREQNTIAESQIATLPYLQACIKETLRLHPPGPLLVPHRAVETCEILNFKIPQNSTVIVNIWAMGRDPTLWKEPLSFKPERFVGSSLDFKGNDYEYIPFGSGRRMCPGLPMATKVVPLVLASLVAFFDWSVPDGDDPATIDMNEKLRIATLMKEQPLVLIPRRKS